MKKLIEDNMGLVYFVLNRYFPSYRGDEDLIQCGMVGLCQAAQSWDESKSSFSSYATKGIYHSMLSEFRNRKKHYNILSLDYPVESSDGECSFGDLCAGDEDVDFVDFESFYSALSPSQKQIVDWKMAGLSGRDIAKKLGVSHQTVNQTLRLLKPKWKKLVGGNEE